MKLTDTSRIILEKTNVFAGLPQEALVALREHLETRHIPAGTVLFSEGDEGDRMLIIRSGLILIIKQQDGETFELARRGAGEIVGEMALLDASPRFASAIAEKDSEVFELERADFFAILASYPDIVERILQVLTRRIREADTVRLRELEQKNRDLESARARLEVALTYRDRILSVAPYPVIVTDPEQCIRLVNPAAERLFETPYPPRFRDWVRIRDRAKKQAAEEAALSAQPWGGEVEVDGPGGHVLLCKMLAVPIADTGNGEAGRLWILEDMTEMRALEQQAIEHDRLAMKGEMAAEIAHELKNYLMVLSGHIELLSINIGTRRGPDINHSLDAIERSLDRMRVFTDNLLQSRHPAGEKIAVDLNDFLQSQITFLRPQKRFAAITIGVDWSDPLPRVVCDPSGLQQVFYNLMLNAADALADAGITDPTVTVRTRLHRADSMVGITVTDNGRGIPPGILDRLFKERASSKPSGHGFGLLTVRRIVEENNGSIRVTNRPEGGAEFDLRFPATHPST